MSAGEDQTQQYGITPDQLRVYKALERFLRVNQYSPTHEELARETKLTPKRVRAMLNQLKERGYVTWKYKRHRSLMIVNGLPTVPNSDRT